MSRTLSFSYNAASQLTSASDPDSTYAYTYDNIGRVLTVDNNGTSGIPRVILTSVYDANSNRSSLAATVAGTADFKNDYTYDNLGRMTQVAQIGNGGNTVANKRANFAYNAVGQFTSIERQVKPSSTWNEVATTAFTYDTLNRVTGIDHKRAGTSLFTAYSYTYDRMDRITGITSQDGTVAYTYDKTSQLTAADYSYQTDETFTWDANGNRADTGYTTGTNNRMTSDGTYDYTYDDEGNLTLRTKISDSSYTEYTWDHRNRLTNVTDKTSGGTSTMSADYAYDVQDRRIKKIVDADGAGAGASVTTRYVYYGNNVILQYDGSSNLKHRYLHGPAVDQLLADEDSTNALLWSLADHLGTPRDLVNDSAATQNHLKFLAFGNVTAESASSVDFLMGLAGMDRDEETGNYYTRYRYLGSEAKWLSEDPIGFGAEDPNLGRYVGNAPITSRDPLGLSVQSVHTPAYSWWTYGTPKTPRSDIVYVQTQRTGTAVGPNTIPNITIDVSMIEDKVEQEKMKQLVLVHLAQVWKLPKGQEIITDIAPTKRKNPNPETVTIVVDPKGENAARWPKGDDPNDKKKHPAVIIYNPTLTTGGPVVMGNTERPPYIGLLHELSHASRILTGTLNRTGLDTLDPTLTRDEIIAIEDENEARRQHNERNRGNLPRRSPPE